METSAPPLPDKIVKIDTRLRWKFLLTKYVEKRYHNTMACTFMKFKSQIYKLSGYYSEQMLEVHAVKALNWSLARIFQKRELKQGFAAIQAVSDEVEKEDTISTVIQKLNAANKLWTLLDIHRPDRQAFNSWKQTWSKQLAAEWLSRIVKDWDL